MAVQLEMTLASLAAFLHRRADELARLDLTRPLKTVAVLARSDMLSNFQGSHAPDGTPWLPLKRPRQGKRHKGSNAKPLLDTGILQASVTAVGAQGHVEEITAVSLKVGSNLDRASVHQDGATINVPERTRNKPWVFQAADGSTIFTRRIKAHTVTIPARPFAGWSPHLLERTEQVFGEFLEKQVAE